MVKNLANYITELSYFEIFYEIALQNFQNIQQHVKKKKQKGKKFLDGLFRIENEIDKSAIVVIIFSALTLESFINHYGIKNFSRNYFDDHLDRINPVSKWVLLPKLIRQNDFREKQLVKKLFSQRNKLVHAKTKQKKIHEIKIENFFKEQDAQNAIKTVQKAINDLKRLDPTLNIAWLKVKNAQFKIK